MKPTKLKYLLSLITIISATTSLTAFAGVRQLSCDSQRAPSQQGQFAGVEIRQVIEEDSDLGYSFKVYCVRESSTLNADRTISLNLEEIPLKQPAQEKETVRLPNPTNNNSRWRLFFDKTKKEFGWRCTSPNKIAAECSFEISTQGRPN